MSIENPTLAHFLPSRGSGTAGRHFSSLFINWPSTTVENSLQITPFYAKQTQCQVRQKERKPFYINDICNLGHLVIQKKQSQTNPIKAKTNPIQTQLQKGQKLMQSIYLQRVMMIKPYCGFVKTKPIKANIEEEVYPALDGAFRRRNQSSLITNHLRRQTQVPNAAARPERRINFLLFFFLNLVCGYADKNVWKFYSNFVMSCKTKYLDVLFI